MSAYPEKRAAARRMAGLTAGKLRRLRRDVKILLEEVEAHDGASAPKLREHLETINRVHAEIQAIHRDLR